MSMSVLILTMMVCSVTLTFSNDAILNLCALQSMHGGKLYEFVSLLQQVTLSDTVCVTNQLFCIQWN